MKKGLVYLCALFMLMGMTGVVVAAQVTRTVSATYLGDEAIQSNPIVNKTDFIEGQQYTLFTVTYDDAAKCPEDYWDSDGTVERVTCITSQYNDFYSNATVTFSPAVIAAFAKYDVCPDSRETHWDHAQSWYGSGWVGVDSMYDLYQLFAFWDDSAMQLGPSGYAHIWIKGFENSGPCLFGGPTSAKEFVVLVFGEPASVVDGSGAVDDDGDGHDTDSDCDDTDPNSYPGAPELCDGLDNDCDGIVPDDEMDWDLDGYLACNDDCDDDDSLVNPDADELFFNLVDENCDGDLGPCSPCDDWKNHGHYVRCVAHMVNDLRKSGLLTEDQADGLVSSAAQTDIGKKGYVPSSCQ